MMALRFEICYRILSHTDDVVGLKMTALVGRSDAAPLPQLWRWSCENVLRKVKRVWGCRALQIRVRINALLKIE